MLAVDWPVAIPVTAVLGSAWLWHVLTEHHGAARALRVFRPSTAVRETSHESSWHRTSHPRRLLVNFMLVLAAVLVGLTWELSPGVAEGLVILAALAAAAAGIVRWMSGRSQYRRSRDHSEGGRS